MTMRCLRRLALFEEYRSDRDDILGSFFIPCLDVALTYDRAVGYFTSSGLALAGRGLRTFAGRDGLARLVASPALSEDDVLAIDRGLRARDDVVERRLLDALAEADPMPDNLVTLAWLVSSGRLDIRLAVPTAPGIYHEKSGIFEDSDGCRVAFAGSANETVGGLIANFETIDVFFSWDSTAGRVARKVANFDRLWRGETRNLYVMDLPEAVRRRLVSVSERHGRPGESPPKSRQRRGVTPPDSVQMRDYQETAIGVWLENGGRGILSMATGSGKTKTALACLSRLMSGHTHNGALITAISVPYIHLVDQWADECAEWGLEPIRCYESSTSWLPRAQEAIDTSKILRRPVTLVTTVRTATLGPFQTLLDGIEDREVVLVGDEVHHLGAQGAQSLLRPFIRWRLGLSATPSRWSDAVGTEILDSYFGGVVFEFTIREAIEKGTLTPYHYEPILVELERDELTRYQDVMIRIETQAARSAGGEHGALLRLLEERSNILNHASGKPAAVRRQLAGRRIDRTLFYCASRLQMGAVSDVLRAEGVVPRPFTAEEDRKTRAGVLADFQGGRLPAIVAMKALDEGVDVPGTLEAHILASSGNPREFIQRRGRILRLAPGKDSARLIDYVTVPEGSGNYERVIVEREMTRVLDFAESSLNPDRAREVVWPILNGYGLIHLLGR